MRRWFFTLFAVILSASLHAERVGLVLSGGGAKGVAHIGVIQALEENDIAIDCVAGTSMGAIVGGLYAAGYSPAEMMHILLSQEFADWSTGTVNPGLRYFYSMPEPSPQLLSFALSSDSVAQSVPQSLISPTVMNFAFMELFAPAEGAAKGDFDKLFVPLRTVSSNIVAQRGEVARNGCLGDAIRASMSFPMVFCPITINDTLHYDGGIFENFPVETMRREFNPDIMIGVDVHTPDSISPPPTALNQIDNLVTRPQSYALKPEDGIKIHINLHEYSLLDFPQAQAIYDIGYRRGLEMVDSIKSRVKARRSSAEVQRLREAFKTREPQMIFSRVICEGATPRQNEYIQSLFGHKEITLNKARDGFYRAISSGMLQDLQAYAERGNDGKLTLRLKAFPKAAWQLGLGGYISSSTTSMLYGSVSYNSIGSTNVSAGVGAWIGQSYLAARLLANIRFSRSHSYGIGLEGVVSKQTFGETERLFYQIHHPHFVTRFQGFGRARLLSMPLGRHAAMHLTAGYGYLKSSFSLTDGERHQISHKLGQIAVTYDYNTLNHQNLPVNGMLIHASAAGMLGHRYEPQKVNEKWLQLNFKFAKYFSLNKHFAAGLSANVLASGRKAPESHDMALADAPAYSPTPSCFNSYNAGFRAYSFIGAGVEPIYKPTDKLQIRGSFHIFAPWHKMKKLSSAKFFGEMLAAYDLKILQLSAYVNYRSGNSVERGWHCGLTLGLFILAPNFLE